MIGEKKMSRLVDVHKVQMKLFEECQNIRHFDKGRKKKQIFADGIDFAWVMLDNTPTVKAIPIEWIEKWFSQFYGEQGLEWNRCKRFMLEDWEKENETN